MAFGSLFNGLTKTRQGVFSKINRLITAKRNIDEELLEELEELLISADVGVDTTLFLLDEIRDHVKKERYETSEELDGLIRQVLASLLDFDRTEAIGAKPFVTLVVGVNGTGKTTSIAKLAHYYKDRSETVLLAAADTFRAAAIEQLALWADRVGCDLIRHQHNADPAAVAYDAIDAALARNVDRLIIDTAGRLHTKVNLMTELSKIKSVIEKKYPGSPHEVILVLDAGNGQNALNQAKEFVKAVGVSSIFLTKLDGTARGGVVLGVKRTLGIPVKYIGLGEKITDMERFNPEAFINALFGEK